MRKIISLFQRNYDGDHLVRNELVPGAEWVAAGEGIPTRKLDGTCCMVQGGKLFKRFELKCGKPAPVGFVPAQDPDPVTGDCPGWLPVGEGREDRWHREAFERETFPDGTYELIGPKVQNNPERLFGHALVRHGSRLLPSLTPRTFDELREYFRTTDIEGIVWHHPDGRMVKIKKKDFGFRRGR
jgi:hypothetical protein